MSIDGAYLQRLYHRVRACFNWFADRETLRFYALACMDVSHELFDRFGIANGRSLSKTQRALWQRFSDAGADLWRMARGDEH